MSSTVPRLLYGFLSQSTDPLNISIPWRTSAQDGMFRMNYSEEEAIRDNLVTWAKTNWGDYPMRFRFGLDVRRHLFGPSVRVKDMILQNANDQIPKYFPELTNVRMEVQTIDDNSDIDENEVRFVLEATLASDETKKIKINETVGA